MPDYIIINAAPGDNETLLGELLVYVSQDEALGSLGGLQSRNSDAFIRIYDDLFLAISIDHSISTLRPKAAGKSSILPQEVISKGKV